MNKQPRTSVGSIWKHKKRGTTYEILHYASFQAENNPLDDEPVLIYKSTTEGYVYVRPLKEFCDGRFEFVSEFASK